MTYTHIIKASYGNDSIALIQWAYENRERHKLDRVAVIYNDTGWSRSNWPARVEHAESLVRRYDFDPLRTASIGFVPLVRLKQGFPRHGMQFCTEQLKIGPTMELLAAIDQDREAIVMAGIRREESKRRQSWPEWVEADPMSGERDSWYPLVRVLEAERNTMILRAGFEVLPHRSQECYPCVNLDKPHLRTLDDAAIQKVEALEHEVGKPMFRARPRRGASGIREVVRWAQSDRGKYTEAQGSFCDGGWCGD